MKLSQEHNCTPLVKTYNTVLMQFSGTTKGTFTKYNNMVPFWVWFSQHCVSSWRYDERHSQRILKPYEISQVIILLLMVFKCLEYRWAPPIYKAALDVIPSESFSFRQLHCLEEVVYSLPLRYACQKMVPGLQLPCSVTVSMTFFI